jgi:chlorobactene glucosyltransferase
MVWVQFILFGAWTAVLGVWGFILYQQFLVRRNKLILTPRPATDRSLPDPAGVWPSVAVVVAACNEAAQIQGCLTSVLASRYPALRVRVVDDRSKDDTAARVERIVAQDARVTLLRVTELPPGWMGKTHALWHATRELESQWLLFLDADCRLEPDAIATVIHEVHHRQLDVLSLWPRHDSRSFWEHLLVPLCGGITALWFGSSQVNDPASPKAFANGQFLLVRREAYERIDGHRSVRHALIEDVPFAERAKAAGLRCWVGGGQKLFSVRMYASLRAILNGWARIYVGALRSGTKIVASIAWLLFGSLWPYLVAIGLLGMLFFGRWDARVTDDRIRVAAVLTAAHVVLMMVVSYRFWGMGGCRRRYLWFYPLSVILVIGILCRAWWWLRVSRSVPWRTTRYPITRDGRILPA